MSKFDKIELEAIRTIVRSKVRVAVKTKEDEQNKKQSDAKDAFAILNKEICNKIRERELKKVRGILNNLRKEYPKIQNIGGLANEKDVSADVIINVNVVGKDGLLTATASIVGAISLNVLIEVPEEDCKKWIAARDAAYTTNQRFEVKHEDIDVALAEIILTDRSNMMEKIDEIVAGILKKSGV